VRKWVTEPRQYSLLLIDGDVRNQTINKIYISRRIFPCNFALAMLEDRYRRAEKSENLFVVLQEERLLGFLLAWPD